MSHTIPLFFAIGNNEIQWILLKEKKIIASQCKTKYLRNICKKKIDLI